MDINEYDLDGVSFVEIEVEVTRTETVVFAVTNDGSGLGTAGAPSQKVGTFMRTLNYWVMQTRSLAKSERAAMKRCTFPEHDRDCEMWIDVGPDDPTKPCHCRRRIFERCEPGSLNHRRVRRLVTTDPVTDDERGMK